MKKLKRQAPRMPRKMKKHFKSLMAFFEERRVEYEQSKYLCFMEILILEKLKGLGISSEDVEDIRINDISNIFVKLKGSIKQATITINMNEIEEGTDNAANN